MSALSEGARAIRAGLQLPRAATQHVVPGDAISYDTSAAVAERLAYVATHYVRGGVNDPG